jgi:hypothetical protein
MTTDTEAYAPQPSGPQVSAAPLMGNPVLMRAASRTRGWATSGPIMVIASAVVILLAAAIGASYWVIHSSQRPLIVSVAAPPAAVGTGPTVPAAARTPTRLAATIAHHPKRRSVLVRNEHHALRRLSPRARDALEAGSDVSAVTTASPPAAPGAYSPPAAPSTPPVIMPPATPAPEAP